MGGLVAGVTYGAKKDSALALFQQALKLNPDSAIARIEYANGLIMLFGIVTPAHAQVDRATLTGIVRDPSDAVVAAAKVKITSLATNAVNTATTSSDGTYLVVNLAPGEYLVQVEAPGFQRFERTVALELGARSRLDMILAVGSINSRRAEALCFQA